MHSKPVHNRIAKAVTLSQLYATSLGLISMALHSIAINDDAFIKISDSKILSFRLGILQTSFEI